MQVLRTQHVSVPRPPGRDAESQAVDFYAGILGLRELPKPPTFANLDVTWFAVGDTELHVFASDRGPHPGSHFCLQVEDLRSTRRHLESAGVACHETDPIPHRPRFMIHDPFGNAIEITQIAGDYRSVPA